MLPEAPIGHRVPDAIEHPVSGVIPMFDVILFMLAFIVLDLIALRFGACSRPTYHRHGDRPDW